jgi:hypothetical protein
MSRELLDICYSRLLHRVMSKDAHAEVQNLTERHLRQPRRRFTCFLILELCGFAIDSEKEKMQRIFERMHIPVALRGSLLITLVAALLTASLCAPVQN